MPDKEDFDPGLWKLLQRTWNNITSIHSYSEIYAWYNEADYAVAESYNPNEMNYFLRGLQELGKRAANYAEIRVQEPGWPTLADALQDPDFNNLWETFYHFVKKDRKAVTKRIYVHVAEPYVEKSLELMKALVEHLGKVKGFDAVKVAGPAAVGRKDQIIAYLTDDTSRSEILSVLRKLSNQKTNAVLKKGAPLCVKEEFPGVGIADEPPAVGDLFNEKPGQSFGKYLAQLIWFAVDEYLDAGHGKDKFLENVQIALKTGGIDAKEPHLHAQRQSIETLNIRGKLARNKRLAHTQAATKAATQATTQATKGAHGSRSRGKKQVVPTARGRRRRSGTNRSRRRA